MYDSWDALGETSSYRNENHPEKYLVLLSKKIFFGSKYPKKHLIKFRKKLHWDSPELVSTATPRHTNADNNYMYHTDSDYVFTSAVALLCGPTDEVAWVGHDPWYFFLIIQKYNLRGDLSNISAETTTLVMRHVCTMWRPPISSPYLETWIDSTRNEFFCLGRNIGLPNDIHFYEPKTHLQDHSIWI